MSGGRAGPRGARALLSGQARASWRRWLLLRREKELQALAGRQKWGSTFPGERDRECVKAGRPNGPWGAAGQRRRDRSPESCHRHRVADTFPYSDSDQWLSPARTTRPSPTPTGARKGAALMTGCGQALVAFAGQDRECCVTAEGRTLPPRVPLTYLCQTPVDVPRAREAASCLLPSAETWKARSHSLGPVRRGRFLQ